MEDKYRKYEQTAMTAAYNGDWETAIKFGKYVPRNWDVWQRFPSTAMGHGGIPPEWLDKVLDAVPQSGMPNFLFELATQLHDDIKPETLERIAKLGIEDRYVLAGVEEHPNWKPSQEHNGRLMAASFWNTYEKAVHSSHFATIKSMFTKQPESLTDHRGREGNSHGNCFVWSRTNMVHNFDHDMSGDMNPHVERYEANGPTQKFFKTSDVLPHLPGHAKAVQDAIQADDFLPKRYFNGKPYIQLHRGVGGGYAKAIRDKVAHDPATGETDNRSYTLPTAHLTSWTSDREMAERFATSRGDHDGVTGKGVVISAWHPLDSVLHSGYHTVTPGQNHTHDNEQEIIVGHPQGKFKIHAKNLHFQDAQVSETGQVSTPVDGGFKPAKVRKSDDDIDPLEKAAPKYVGEVDHDKDNIAVPHPHFPGVATWQHSPAKAKNFQAAIDKNIDNFTNQYAEHGPALKAALARVSANKKHTDLVLTDVKRQGIHTPRRRHVAALVSGNPSSVIKHMGNGEFLWRQERHPEESAPDSHTYWKISAQGIQDVSKDHKDTPKDFFKSSDGHSGEILNGNSGRLQSRGLGDAGRGVLGRSPEPRRQAAGLHDSQRANSPVASLPSGGHSRLAGRSPSGNARPQNSGTGRQAAKAGPGELEKGQNGDWEKEGYRIEHGPRNGGYRVEAHSKDGKRVGYADFTFRYEGAHRKIYPEFTEIHPEHRRKGLASAMYKTVETATNLKVIPSEQQSSQAELLWYQSNRPFGKSLQKTTESHMPNFRMSHALQYIKQTLEAGVKPVTRELGVQPDASRKIYDDTYHSPANGKTLYHHVFPTTNSTHHTLSLSPNPSDTPLSYMLVEHYRGTKDWKGTPSVRISYSQDKGFGLGSKLYEEALKHHKRIQSDGSTSPSADKTWTKLISKPGVKGQLGEPEDSKSRHYAELEKGKRGDWQKEGYTYKHTIEPIEVNPGHHLLTVKAYHPSGETVGTYSFAFGSSHPQLADGRIPLHTATSRTLFSHQRKGIASGAYAYAERAINGKVYPGFAQSEDAEDLWKQPNRPFGKALEKGQNGDWQKEGYTFKQGPSKYVDGNHTVHAFDKTGERVGFYSFNRGGSNITVNTSNTDTNHQRKGLATQAYKMAEEFFGLKLAAEPSVQSPQAKGLWNQPNRPFAKALAKAIVKFRPKANNKQATSEFQPLPDSFLHSTSPLTVGELEQLESHIDQSDKIIEMSHPSHDADIVDWHMNYLDKIQNRIQVSMDVGQKPTLAKSSQLAKSWHVKVKNEPGYHKMLDMQDLGPGKGNHYILEGGRKVHQDNIEHVDMSGKKPTTPLEKGQNGDWQKEGYTLKFHKINASDYSHMVTAHDRDGREVGCYKFRQGKIPGQIHITESETDELHRRKGLASTAYQLAEKHLNAKIIPKTLEQTPEAKRLWDQPNRPFGKSDWKARNSQFAHIDNLDKSLKKSNPPQSNAKIRAMADGYAAPRGLQVRHGEPPARVDPAHAVKIAAAYEAMPHSPTHPDTQRAYDALIEETTHQLHHLQRNGFRFTKIQQGMENPYKAGSKELFKDLAENNHAWYYPSESGFGTDAQTDFSDNPLLRQVKDLHGNSMPANDAFRIVHDVFGHAKEGNGFGPHGEENAWRHHMQMYSPEAQKAMTSETRGQNSWVNYGPHGEENRANPVNTIYADQKTGIMPEWVLDTNNGINKNPLAKSTLAKVFVDPSNAVPTVQSPHEGHKYIAGNSLRDGFFHHVFKQEGGGYLHTISRSSDHKAPPLASITGSPTFHNQKWGLKISGSAAATRREGHGSMAYQATLLHHGFIVSDTQLSPASHSMYTGALSGTPGVYVKAAEDETDKGHYAKVIDKGSLTRHLNAKPLSIAPLEKRSKNVREQTRNITSEQAIARRVEYAKRLGLRPERIEKLTSMFPHVNPTDHAAIRYTKEAFPVEHETAHAMMTPQGSNIPEYTHGLSYANTDATAAERVKFDMESKTAENTANQLEHRIDRRAGVGVGTKGGKHLSHVSNQRTFVNAPTWNDETRDTWLRGHNMDRQWHDNNQQSSRALNSAFGESARTYVGRFDEGSKFNAKGQIVPPTGINAKINARTKKSNVLQIQNRLAKSNEGVSHIASVAVVNGNTLLMAKRNDNGRWTLPGGGMNIGEKPSQGAFRELWEEAGIKPDQLRYLGSEKITSFTGKSMMIHVFAAIGNYEASVRNDPDQEVGKWEKIDISNGLPPEIANNLHSPKNVVLKMLGLLNY